MTGPWHPTGRARVSVRNPQAIGVSQRSGFWYQRAELTPQYEWEGVKLQNLELYVHPSEYDTPQHQLKTIVIPADPLPVYRPFPEEFSVVDAGGGPVGFDPNALRPGNGAAVMATPSTPQTPTTGSGGMILVDENAEPWEASETGDLPDIGKMEPPKHPARRKTIRKR